MRSTRNRFPSGYASQNTVLGMSLTKVRAQVRVLSTTAFFNFVLFLEKFGLFSFANTNPHTQCKGTAGRGRRDTFCSFVRVVGICSLSRGRCYLYLKKQDNIPHPDIVAEWLTRETRMNFAISFLRGMINQAFRDFSNCKQSTGSSPVNVGFFFLAALS